MRVLVLAALLSLALCVASADAATRYAAPGGTGADPCASQAEPCSIYTAAAVTAPGTTVKAGDVVMLAPGTYTDVGGDLGPSQYVQSAANVRVQGEPGGARPLIRLESNEGYGAFLLAGGATISDIAIDNVASGLSGHNGPALSIDAGGVAERIVAHSTLSSATTCTMLSGGILRESVCINDAPNGTALGAGLLTSAGTRAVTVRDVTAIATGPSSFGVSFNYFGSEASPTIFNVSLKGVIARGQLKDVRAAGLRNGPTGVGATTNITLDHSDYVTTDTTLVSGGGSASVTPAGSGTNITDAPLFAADGYHQLPTSPTVDKGAVDGSSGTVDLDAQLRTIGSAPDIGADELAHATTLTIACSPQAVAIGESPNTTQCAVTVTDTAAAATAPTGSVALGTDGGIATAFCALAPVSAVSSGCSGTWPGSPPGIGAHQLSARYGGDSSHDGSEGTTTVTVAGPHDTGPPGGGSGGGGGNGGGGSTGGSSTTTKPPPPAPATILGKHPPKRTPNRLARFTFSADQSAAAFECRLDRAKFKPCRSPFRREVAFGAHTFAVRASAGPELTDKTPVVFHWTRFAR